MSNEKFDDYIYINRLYLKLIALWPNEENNIVRRIFFHKFRLFIFAIFLWILLLLPLLLDLYVVWGNSYAIFQNVCLTIHAFAVCLKFTHVAMNQTEFKVLMYCSIPELNISVIVLQKRCK